MGGAGEAAGRRQIKSGRDPDFRSHRLGAPEPARQRPRKASLKLFADETTAPVLDPGRRETKTGQLKAVSSARPHSKAAFLTSAT